MASPPIARSAVPAPLATGSRLNALRYRAKVALSGPTTIIGLLLAALFTYLIVMPVLSILLDAVRVQFGDERRLKAGAGDFTTYYLERAFTSRVARDLF